MNDQHASLGKELFRQGFMAVDYLEMKLIPHRSHRSHRSRHSSRHHEAQSGKNSKPSALRQHIMSERGDVPGWVLVVLMTTGLVTAIWAVAAPRLNTILKNSLDSMGNIR